jgi:hypothetical protein
LLAASHPDWVPRAVQQPALGQRRDDAADGCGGGRYAELHRVNLPGELFFKAEVVDDLPADLRLERRVGDEVTGEVADDLRLPERSQIPGDSGLPVCRSGIFAASSRTRRRTG